MADKIGKDDLEFRCVWCGWKGTMDEMDMNENDKPSYCPECGHGQFDVKVDRKEKKHG